METSNQHPEQKMQVVVMKTEKSLGIAILLAILFGPLGMLYATVKGGIIMLVISLIVVVFTLGFGALITWPVCVVWAAMAANDYNKSLQTNSPGQQRVSG